MYYKTHSNELIQINRIVQYRFETKDDKLNRNKIFQFDNNFIHSGSINLVTTLNNFNIGSDIISDLVSVQNIHVLILGFLFNKIAIKCENCLLLLWPFRFGGHFRFGYHFRFSDHIRFLRTPVWRQSVEPGGSSAEEQTRTSGRRSGRRPKK